MPGRNDHGTQPENDPHHVVLTYQKNRNNQRHQSKYNSGPQADARAKRPSHAELQQRGHNLALAQKHADDQLTSVVVLHGNRCVLRSDAFVRLEGSSDVVLLLPAPLPSS